MRISSMRVTCLECKHVFDGEAVMDAPIDIALASLRALRCPKCGAGSDRLGMGGAFDDAPPLDSSINERSSWWRKRGDVGTSSTTIWSVMTDHRMASPDVPHDPDDFIRCRKLLTLIPEWRPPIRARLGQAGSTRDG